MFGNKIAPAQNCKYICQNYFSMAGSWIQIIAHASHLENALVVILNFFYYKNWLKKMKIKHKKRQKIKPKACCDPPKYSISYHLSLQTA